MAPHPLKEEEKSDESIFYLVGLLSGLFVGCILGSGFIWIPILGAFGLLFAGFFYTVFVKGRNSA
jgi:hypothetical protein